MSRKGSEGTGDTGGYAVRVAEGGAGGTAGRRPREPGPCRGHESGGGVGDTAQADQGAGSREPSAEGRERVFSGGQRFFRREPSEVSKKHRMRFAAQKTDGEGKIALYCRVLKVN